MTLVEAIHRCLVVGFTGPTIPDHVKHQLDRGLGGVILHTRNVTDAGQLRDLTDALRSHRPDILIGIDQEGAGIGHLSRAQAPESPGAWTLGVVDDTALTAALAGALATHLATLGITVSYSPVADVQREPTNPIVRTRAFGGDPDLVARHVAAWTTATLAAGVAPCAKHFPGHGSTTTDSHEGVAVDEAPLDLLPFEAAIAAGTPLIMTAHVRYPALAPLPATLSNRILIDLLRDELGYEGVIVTDALEMKAIAAQFGEAAGAWLALAAGADQLIIAAPDPDLQARCVDAIAEAVADGSLPAARLTDAADRIEALGARFGTPPARRDADMTFGQTAARRAIRWLGPPRPVHQPFVVDMYRPPHPALEWDRADLVVHIGSGGVSLTAAPVNTVEILRRAAGRPLVIATEDPALHPWQAEVRAALLAARPDAILVATGLPDATAALCTYGRGRPNLQAAAAALTI